MISFLTWEQRWWGAATELLSAAKEVLSGGPIDAAKIEECNFAAEKAMKCVARLSSILRSNRVTELEGRNCHPLSPESEDPWGETARLVRSVLRSVGTGDEDDLNHIARARVVERRLSDAIDGETQLSIAKARVVSLEKSLSSRSKEIGLQNARLSELEQLLAQTMDHQTTTASRSPDKKAKLAKEVDTLKEENRVLNEAMETLHAQVDEYEREIKALKAVGRAAAPPSARKPPRKSASFGGELHSSVLGEFAPAGPLVSAPKALALEAALFRPALSAARTEAMAWKAKAVGNTMASLRPLSVSKPGRKTHECAEALSLAEAKLRSTRATFSVVDLSKSGGAARSRIRHREEIRRGAEAAERLGEAVRRAHDALSELSSAGGGVFPAKRDGLSQGKGGALVGRVTVTGSGGGDGGGVGRIVPLVVNAHELRGLHSHLLQ